MESPINLLSLTKHNLIFQVLHETGEVGLEFGDEACHLDSTKCQAVCFNCPLIVGTCLIVRQGVMSKVNHR